MYVFINMSMTADGKIATANRRVSSFGSQRDHDHLLELRTQADAVLAGARTVDLNPVNLGPGTAKYRTMRLKRGLAEYNLRVVVSRRGTLDLDAEIFKQKFSPIIILTTGLIPPARLRRLEAVADEVKIFGKKDLDFPAALKWLKAKWKANCLLCEGGGELNDALFQAGVVNELHLTICPKIFGGKSAPTIADGMGALKLKNASQLKLKSFKRHGDELFLVFCVLK
jgi:2,5-diamino-6-(ribosylamino)-4(3H)-pyrimidinone 5'-phosphate reductase